MKSFLGWALFAISVLPAPSARADEVTLIAPGGIREAIERNDPEFQRKTGAHGEGDVRVRRGNQTAGHAR